MTSPSPLSLAISLSGLLLLAFSPQRPLAASDRHVIENPTIRMVVIPRSAEQMAAFYEGREFPQAAIEATRAACFFTIGIRNRSNTILWLDTEQWQFNALQNSPQRIRREDWKQQWQKLDIEQRFQSTFRWTLLPDLLDFQPGEREGGNLTLRRTDEPFTLTARFDTGADRQGEPVVVTFRDLRCLENPLQ